MRRVVFTRRFEKELVEFTASHPELKKKVKATMTAIVADPFDARLKTHKLSGRLKECLASNITYKYRIIFLSNPDEVRFIDIGSHDEVYW